MRQVQRILTSLSPMKHLLMVLVCLVIADGLITQYLVNENLAREGNPLLQPIVGKSVFLLVKVLGALVCAYILWDIYKRWAKLAVISTSVLVICYTGIVVWNVSIYLTA